MILVIETPYNTIQVGKIIDNKIDIEDLQRAMNAMKRDDAIQIRDDNGKRIKTIWIR